MGKMKKSEYYAKKYFVAYYDEDAEELARVLKDISSSNKEFAQEMSAEIEKINNKMLQFENNSNRDEKIKKLIESYKIEVKNADKDMIS